MPEIDFKPGAVNVVNSLRRRPQNYHKKLLQQAAGHGDEAAAKSIHDRVRVKEEGLEKALIYDRYDRSCFRTYLFNGAKIKGAKTVHAFGSLALDEARA